MTRDLTGLIAAACLTLGMTSDAKAQVAVGVGNPLARGGFYANPGAVQVGTPTRITSWRQSFAIMGQRDTNVVATDMPQGLMSRQDSTAATPLGTTITAITATVGETRGSRQVSKRTGVAFHAGFVFSKTCLGTRFRGSEREFSVVGRVPFPFPEGLEPAREGWVVWLAHDRAILDAL